MPPPELQTWRIELLRLTVFTDDALSDASKEWWNLVAGGAPETRTEKPLLGMYSLEGAVPNDTCRLALALSPGRVDWVMTPTATADELLPHLGSIADNRDRFIERFSNWLRNSPVSIKRAAFGSVFQLPVENKVRSYQVLAELLRTVQIDPVGSTDFSYQINRPRISTDVAGLAINRLSKWNSFRTAFLPLQSIQRPPEQHFCRVEIDINSSPEWTGNLAPGAESLFRELVSLGLEIVEKGDIP